MLLSQAVTGRDMSDLIYDVPEYNATYDAERLVNWSPPATAPPPVRPRRAPVWALSGPVGAPSGPVGTTATRQLAARPGPASSSAHRRLAGRRARLAARTP